MTNQGRVCAGLVALGLFACAPEDQGGSGVEVRVAANATRPLDSTPDPVGEAIYYLADQDGGRALLRVDGGDPAVVAAGLGDARSLAIDADGQTIVVADGGLERIAVTDGARSRIVEAEDHDVRGVDLVGGDVYFTGVDPADGEVGLFRVPLAGGAVEVVGKGFGDAELDGLARASDGTVYASDQLGVLWRSRPGAAPESVVSGIVVGDPAGVALTTDESTLLISSLSAAGTSQVVLLDTAALTTSVFDDTIAQNIGSGGVHRAHKTDVFSWCGVTTDNGAGVVYRISF